LEGAFEFEKVCTSQKFGDDELEAKIQNDRLSTSCILYNHIEEQ